ncbi:Eco57I restriction-modification methylase domain-containing protein [Actinoplanes xinjiangensis]|uniref:site-specific DNA-methyltransferase (adenine-specific) n=1 Tax=Actinoplanes xinjiangensis TaxID=512350 RepID=A0A316EGI1_9ACTN|nr:DNA methyltransferase [Actinoplanes xinjiangensis]PWK30810.1 hypothetical protein BC793_13632 [Actinoplanes xinjiangensis]GIF44256.1 hypothetical protein Axi01nite_85670 [Actinoplanes xinjiangensis]
MHVYRRNLGTPLTSARGNQPALSEQAAALCRDAGTPLALLTDGRLWVLVHASGDAPGYATFDADLWLEEQSLLRAFATLLAAPRVLAPPVGVDDRPSTSLAGLFARSADALTQVTNTLGAQVRQAVELFVAELARLDREAGGALLRDVSEREIYRGSLTVLMRLVFLLYAEEQKLLPVADPLYAQAYAASTLYDELGAVRALHGDEVTDRRTAAWPRLLALFAAVHGGCEHPDLWIPAYGGSLLNPGRFPWLTDAAVTDRVVYQILDALLILRHRGRAAERLSYSSLDVEQIGHVYEGLLEFSCIKVDAPHVGLIGNKEPEVSLNDLESAAGRGDDAFRAWLIERCGLTARQLSKALAATPSQPQLAALHAACDNDADLSARIRPHWGLLRTDLRDAPTVFPAGSVLFTQVGDRRATGTHYTPKALAEEVVQHTLAPLLFAREAAGVSRAKSAAEILKLKVLDPAMGSGAFLVSACRYLADVLVRAWERDGIPVEAAALAGAEGNRDDLLLAAQRMVAARCLYGVDRDDMAVELAKLSLWLITLAKDKPFGFLDHALRCGDSLVGLTSAEQLAAFHLDPMQGRWLNNRAFAPVSERLHELLGEITELRESIESSVVEDARDAADKANRLAQAQTIGRGLRLAADAVVGAALSVSVGGQHRPRGPEDHGENLEDRLTRIGDDVYTVLSDAADPALEQRVRATVNEWLRGGRPESIRPLHWPLEFPEVVNRGGFDAIVGNPPFSGGTMISGRLGKDLLTYIQQVIAEGRTAGGRADLCAYFLLRNLAVSSGRVGMIATNTIAQGDTKEVGLDRAAALGWQVYRATKSQRWPGKASLEVSLIWIGHKDRGERSNLDGQDVFEITPSLLPRSRVAGNPKRLKENFKLSFKGVEPGSMGYVVSEEEASALIAKDSRNGDVLYPYINADDLNSRRDGYGSRWIINFHDWPIEKARTYSDVFAIAEERVKPDCQQKNPQSYAGLMDRWWIYWRRRSDLLKAISGMDRVIAIARHSRVGLPLLVPADQVLSEALVVFAKNDTADLALLSSNMHFIWWTTKGESSLRTDARYTPSDGFETFAQPDLTPRMNTVGRELDTYRRSVMLGRDLGLTKLYNLVHDEGTTSADVRRLREIHGEIDEAVTEAYGWSDLVLGHGFHDTRQGRRFTIDPAVQVEVLDRLLELNHQRHAEELAAGRTAVRAVKPKNSPPVRRNPSAKSAPTTTTVFDDGLFPMPDALF